MSASLPCVVRHSRRLSAALWRRGPRPQPYTSSHPACFTSIAAPDAIQSAIQSALDSDDIVVDDDSSSTAATAASAAAMAALSADYVPRWRYQHSSIRQPSRSDILQSYRAMLRLTRKTAQGAQQLWAKQRSEHWQGAPKPEQQQSPQQAAKTALQLFEYSDKWLVEVRQQYRAHQHEKDEQRIAALQLDALEYVALLNANMEHSREVYQAGWGMQQATKAHISNTARRVGLQVSESTLDKEVEAELTAEAAERGEGKWSANDTASRLEAVERRKRKEVHNKAEAVATVATAAADSSTPSTDKQ